MDEKEFTWSGLFLVTACSSFLFSGMVKLLDGSYSDLLLLIGGIALLLTVSNWVFKALKRQRS
jgi:hypothetical protein